MMNELPKSSDLERPHPMPINRGLEVESAVADGPHSWVFRQVRHGVAVRMSILYLILAGGDP